MTKTLLTAERLREAFHYDRATGVLSWAVKTARAKNGAEAGALRADGYRFVGIDGSHYLAHRLIWMHVTGAWPKEIMDHRNGIRSDNRFENLREATYSINNQNRRSSLVGSQTGLLGVSRNGSGFAADIKLHGITKSLGTYRTPEEAYAVYLEAKRNLHPGCTI